MFCSLIFAGGNVLYALLGTFPRTDYRLRVWLMLAARFLVGSGTGQERRNKNISEQLKIFHTSRKYNFKGTYLTS